MRSIRFLCISLLAAVALFVPACASEDEYQGAKAQAMSEADALSEQAQMADQGAAKLDEKITQLEATISSLSASIGAIQDESIKATVQAQVATKIAELRSQIDSAGEQAASLHADAEKARAAAGDIRKRVSESDTSVAKAEAAAESAGGVASNLALLIPGGAGFAGLAGWLVRLLRKGSQLKSEVDRLNGKVGAAATAVRSIDTVTKLSPEIEQAWNMIKPMLAKAQTPEAKQFVDEVQGMLPVKFTI